MTWREYIEREVNDATILLQTVSEALDEGDAMGVGILVGRAMTKLDSLSRVAYHVTKDTLDQEAPVK